MKKIIIDSNKLAVKLCAVENKNLIDFKIENKLKKSLVGNIYKGKVINVLNEKKCAFIELGEKNTGFLNFKDVKGISKVIAGRDVIVQVVSDSVGDKMPKITTEISFRGSYSVLLLNSSAISFSKKITSNEKREFFRNHIADILPDNCGIIFRTESEKQNIDIIIEELRKLIKRKELVESFYVLGSSPKLIKSSDSAVEEFVNNYAKGDYEIITNDLELYDTIEKNHEKKNIKLFRDNNILDGFGILNEINKIFLRKIPLSGGGFVVFDNTEACTVIDVNSGSHNSQGNSSIAYSVNLEAVKEIVKQIKFRSISGMILIDFIDNNIEKEREKLLNYAKDEFKKINGNVLGFTRLGILEITRKRENRNIMEEYFDECSKCLGSGYENNLIDSAGNFINEIRRMSYHYNTDKFKFIVRSNFYNYILENGIINKNGRFYENHNLVVVLELSEDIDKYYKISY